MIRPSRSSSLRVASLLGAAAILIAGAACASCNGVLGNEAIVFDVDAAAADADLDAPSNPSIDATQGKDAAPIADGGCSGAIDCERTVFVTRAQSSGDLGGLAGADVACQRAADGAPSIVKGRQFVAWLSVRFTSANVRLVHGSKSYKRTDGHVIAANWDELVSGMIREPIEHDETGAMLPNATPVWTGTLGSGGLYTPNCEDWSTASNAASGALGVTTAKDVAWTANIETPCATSAALYCIER